MQRYVDSIIDVVLDRTADELIAGILVALLLALALAGAFALLKRKINDVTTLITCLALAMNLVAMTVAAGFIRGTRQQGFRGNASFRGAIPPMPQSGGDRLSALARVAFEQADADRNGVLSAEEAAIGAEKFIKQAEAVQGESINEGLLRAALRRHTGSGEMFGPAGGPGFDSGHDRPDLSPAIRPGTARPASSPN